jgi:hypothetical protein
MRNISLAALALLAGAAACRPQAPGSPSARGAYQVAVANTGGQSCYLTYRHRRDLPDVVRVGYVSAGDTIDFTVRDPESRSLTLAAECGGQSYIRRMRLLPDETLELVLPSMFRVVQRGAVTSGDASMRAAEKAAERTRPTGPNREPAPTPQP